MWLILHHRLFFWSEGPNEFWEFNSQSIILLNLNSKIFTVISQINLKLAWVVGQSNCNRRKNWHQSWSWYNEQHWAKILEAPNSQLQVPREPHLFLFQFSLKIFITDTIQYSNPKVIFDRVNFDSNLWKWFKMKIIPCHNCLKENWSNSTRRPSLIWKKVKCSLKCFSINSKV